MSGDASLEGGSYDVIRKRLLDQATLLGSQAEALNDARKKVFGGSELALVANERVRTEHSCVVRDIVSVSGRLLFGFQVFLGLKADVTVKDAFGLYSFERGDDGWKLEEVAFEGKGDFLADETFAKDLRDTFRYAKGARLLRMKRTETRLLASVQVGASVKDVKVLRWATDGGGRLRYLDTRGDEDLVLPRQHDFAWKQTGREDQVAGKYPHVNVLDTVFVETVGGDLTVKVENNTKDGRGIYREPVDDPNQTLDDSDIAYAQVGQLILLRIKPFREQAYRYLVFDSRARKVVRVDAIGLACHALPDDHGIVFPGGYYLQSGEHKLFDGDVSELFFERMVKAPNGEDVLYVYHHHDRGEYLLLTYNAIRKDVANPIRCHGFSLFDDGTMAVVRAVEEPTRVHPLQIWKTPFATAEHAAAQPKGDSYLAKVGNADLVRGISDALSIRKLALNEKPTRATFEDLVAAVTRALDAHYWLGHADANDLKSIVTSIKSTALLVLDEFDKVEAIERRAREALAQAQAEQAELLTRLRPDDLLVVDDFLRALTTLKGQRGKLITLKDLRGVDLAAIGALESEVAAQFDAVSAACVQFFLKEQAFAPLLARLDEVVKKVEATAKASDLSAYGPELDLVQDGLTLLAEVVSGLRIDDATARTRILEGIEAAFAQQNRARAVFQGKKKDLSLQEGRAEFGAQFRLFAQSVTGALARCDTPEACDEQLSKLLLALEELEGRFGELDAFSADLIEKREEVQGAVGARRQQLLDERNRRAEGLVAAAERILAGVGRRVQTFSTADELNAYFASDAMVQKLTDIQFQLAAMGETVREGAIASRIKSARQDALRTLRDKNDMFEAGSNVIKLGEHRFAVHTQPLELALVPREDGMHVHLTGTDFFEIIEEPALDAARDLWDRTVVSESPGVYRAEYLAASLLLEAEEGKGTHAGQPASIARLEAAARDGTLEALVRTAAQERLDEGYERGIHDHDGARILERLLALRASAGLLRYSAAARSLALLFWATLPGDASAARNETSPRGVPHARARALGRLASDTGHGRGQMTLAKELEPQLAERAKAFGLDVTSGDVAAAARVLVLELAAPQVRFTASEPAHALARDLLASLDARGTRRAFEDEVRALEGHLREQLALTTAYVDAFTAERPGAAAHVLEAAVMLLTDRALVSGVSLAVERAPSAASVEAQVGGLLGVHPRITSGAMTIAIDAFLGRLIPFVTEESARFRAFRQLKLAIVERERARLRLSEFAPRVLTSFVRNRLIDKVYLPLVGANLAKQLGAAGAKKRTDLMGLLLLVSPPGYGKTTLMEYVASKLGLVFMKVNGPAIGHEVTSLDPADAKSATARQEVEKINLAFEMGQNVMLYLDDIQHVSSELLQKFISLCDAQRRIEGVWKGKSRTYDLRGKKFCIVMAGNPYTETGARFQIPDMLANRADTYNLGDILGGAQDLFAASYVENALTSSSVLAPLATRPPEDLFKMMAMARGESVPLTDLSHGYSAAEVEEITAVLRHLARIQDVLLEVNRQYIASASQDDAYRTEPPFKLQGSYRNMTKLTEKVVSAMNADEIERLVDDHYASESQTLTAGAEQNLLKLAELRGRMTDAQRARWNDIKEAYVRTRRTGGKGDDPVSRVTGALSGLDAELGRIRETLGAIGRPRVEVSVDDGGADTATAVLEVVRAQGRAMEQALRGVIDVLGAARTAPVAPAPSPRVEATPPITIPQMEELLTLVRGLDVRLASVPSSAHRVEVVLDGASASNLYRGLDGQDVVAHGGVFVATYAKPPPLGAPVVLGITMPGGVRFDVGGAVSFVQDDLGEGAPAGFGVRITTLPQDARAFFEQFAVHREPLVRE